MSLLLGVGGADRRNEVQSFREDIRHQPESQYNSDFSMYRSTSSLQPIWRELPVADEILSSSSSTAIDPGSSTSAAFRTRSGMTEEKHWQDTQKNDTVRAEGFNPSKAEGYRYISSGAQPNGKLTNTYRGLESPILPSNFGYSPQSASRSNENMNSFTFSARNPQELVKNSNSTLDERLRRSDMDPGFTQKNEKSWKLGTSDAEANSPLRNSSRPSCTTHQKFTSEARATQVLENEAVVFPGSNKPTYSGDIADSKQAYTEKKTPEVFVFGASSGENSFKSSEAQQKLFQSSFIKPSSKSRVSKFKRHSNSMKGKGLAPIGGSGIQQFAPTFSREASPESVTGSATESSQLDEAECSDTGIWQREKVDERIAREKNELLRSEYMQEENSGAVTQNEQRGLLHRGSEENPPQSEPLCQDSGSTDPKTQENHSLHLHERHNLTNWQALSARFGSWWPFQSKVETDSMEDWEADGSSKTSNEIRISTQFDDTPNEPNTTIEQQEAGGLNPSTTNLKPSESNLQSSLDGFIDSTKPPDGEGADFKFSGTFSGKESTQKSSNGTNDMVWNFGAKDPGQPFVFGAAQHQATHSGQSLTPGACASIGSRVSPSSTSFPLGTSFGPALYKGPTAMSNHTPVTRITSNPDSLKGVNLPSFTELKKEGPTGEFSGPLSCSESSASEGSPSRPEPWQASDKPFYQVHCFQFQGGVKDERDAPSALGKTKSETSSRVRRHAGRLSRSRRAALSASSKNISTPMEFSPIVNSTELSSGSVTLEQPYLSFSETDPMDDGDLPRQLSDFQNMPEPASGSATLNVDTNEGVSAFQARSQDSENLNDWNEPNIFSSKRSGKWKRRGLDEGQSPPSFQRAHGLDGHPEGARSAIDDHTSKINANIHEPIFIFGASSSHTSSNSMQENVALRSQKEKNTEPLEELGADKTVFVPNLDQDRQPHLKPGPAFPYPLVSTDKISLSGVSMSRSNQSYTHVRNFEDSAALNHHFSDGIMGTANAVKSAAAEQVCERWRLRGNQAYAIGDFPKAEEYYSRGANSVSPNETSQSCIRASMLCYSNRAATRMAVGRMREALADCNRAMVVDPGFLRVRLRAASCHLALGESKAAVEMFKECLKYAKENSKSDPKIVVEAMEGVKKSQQLDDYSDRALELLEKQTFVDSTSALRLLNEALSISTFSEPLHELKAQALLSLRRYDECLQFCEQTLPAAERNHGYAVHEKNKDSFLREACQSSQNGHLKLWRWKLSAKALYNLGKLEESLELLVKHEEVSSTGPADKGTDLDSLTPFLANLRDQLRHKVAGNEAFQLGKHAEAVEHYTAALACNSDSRPFNAVCFCNRAAAWQALGHLADAIADCSRAIALDAVYPKALSRRATLHEMIRDHGQACNDLRRLISLLEDQNNETSKGTGSNIYTQDLRQAKERLEKEEEEMKKGHPIDHYLVLGVDFSCSANEIKKAYRKAALKHHPDKAGQFLARSETGDDGGLWNEVGDEVCRDAERLFKLIGEAYGILSDATKRLRYDTEEENRKLRGKDGSNLGSSSEGYRSQHEKSSRRQQRDRWDAWQGFAPQHQRWQSGPDAAQPDTYGHRTTYSGDPAKAGKTTWSTDFF